MSNVDTKHNKWLNMHVIIKSILTSSVHESYLFIIFFSILGRHSSVACGPTPVDLLQAEEARTVDVNVRLVADNMAIRCPRAVYRWVYIKLYLSFSNYYTFVVFMSSFCHIQNKTNIKYY